MEPVPEKPKKVKKPAVSEEEMAAAQAAAAAAANPAAAEEAAAAEAAAAAAAEAEAEADEEEEEAGVGMGGDDDDDDEEEEEEEDEPGTPKAKPKPKRPKEPEREKELYALMLHTLGCVDDTMEVLQKRSEVLEACEKGAQGSRHATVHMATRANQVTRAKLKLLRDLTDRREAFLEVAAKREELVKAVCAGGDPATCGGAKANGFRAFIQASISEGDPRDAEKGNFQHFCRNFGLFPDHIFIETCNKDVEKGVTDWAVTAEKWAIREGNRVLLHTHFPPKDADSDPIEIREPDAFLVAEHVNNVATLMQTAGGQEPDKSKALKNVKKLVEKIQTHGKKLRHAELERYAASLHQKVEEEIEGDEEIARGAQPTLGGKAAQQAAGRLESLVNMTLGRGVQPKHESVRAAKDAINELRAEAVRRNGLVLLHEDTTTFAEQGYVPNMATDLADKIDVEAFAARDLGVSISHDKLTEARALAQELREQEGFRKREAAGAKKRAAAEAKEKAAEEAEEQADKTRKELEKRKMLGMPDGC